MLVILTQQMHLIHSYNTYLHGFFLVPGPPYLGLFLNQQR